MLQKPEKVQIGGIIFVEALETTVLVCFQTYEVDLKLLRNLQSL